MQLKKHGKTLQLFGMDTTASSIKRPLEDIRTRACRERSTLGGHASVMQILCRETQITTPYVLIDNISRAPCTTSLERPSMI